MSWAPMEEDDEPALYGTDEFRIQIMKVLRCSKKYCHDWTRCPFAHPGEKATRRDPMSGTYTGIACPEMRRDQRCPRGHYCPYAHNVFEYWLHPTRYRTALCRDMEKCNRKICFFAHNMHELRSNLERPYVSPEQLLSATQAAAQDPTVQARYLAAAQEKSSKSMFQGIGDEDTGQTLEQLQNMSSLASLTLPAPRPSSQRVETMNALSSIIRGSPERSPSMRDLESLTMGNVPMLPSLKASKIAPLPAASGGPAAQSDAQFSPDRKKSAQSLASPMRKHSSETGTRAAESSKSVETTQGFRTRGPGRTHSLGAVHSWGSQQNLLNATAQLTEEKLGKQSALWSTPRTPFDYNTLYSTASMTSDRGVVDTGSQRNLEMLNMQRLKRRPTRQPSDSSSMGQSSLYSQSASHAGNLLYTGGSYPSLPLYTGSSGSTFSGGRLGGGIGQSQGAYPGGYQSEYAQMLQREQALQQQNLAALQRRQQQVYEQQLQAQLQQNFGRTINPQAPMGDVFGMHDSGEHRPITESRFDLRFGGLGENKGLLTRATGDSSPPQRYGDQLNSMYSEPDMQRMFQNSALFSQGASGSLEQSTLLQALQAQQAQSFRASIDGAPEGSANRLSQDPLNLPLELDLDQRLRFGSQDHGGMPRQP